jgi:hypothetical protein
MANISELVRNENEQSPIHSRFPDRFRKPNGQLTRYAFACGYIEKVYHKRNLAYAELSSPGGCSHVDVRLFDETGKRIAWIGASAPGKARKLARKLLNEYAASRRAV